MNDLILDAENVRDIETITGEIKGICNQFANITLQFYIEVGRRLTEAKELLPHGEWGAWLKDNFEFSQRTASNMMRCFDEYGDSQISLFGAVPNSQTFANLTAVKAVSLLALEPDERENFVAENDVEKMSVRELEKAVKERKEAEEKALSLEQDNDELTEENDSLTRENEKLRALLEEADGKKAEEREKLVQAKAEALTLTEKLEKAKKAADRAKAELAELKANPKISDEVLTKITAEAEEKAAAGSKAAIEKAEADGKAALEKAEAEAKRRLEAAETAKKEASEKLKAYEDRITELEKKIKITFPEMIAFKTAFENAENDINKLMTAFSALSSAAPETADKMKAALSQLADKLKV